MAMQFYLMRAVKVVYPLGVGRLRYNHITDYINLSQFCAGNFPPR